ncbi:PadR family transcriptional regulator [Paenibacillus sp. J31TS4]|uniref:PadR family transcriptional regulator n=1 Tax=Paenibacillus sp. J31TS4 TaxID=2807195 RepID=UPI001B0D5D15|nr:PadR family transcriptional regulator [Paenibacillus sp. J31TS4]GIP38811.1 PadR family transcriptional regulator [Paenibacillus sp. J31TS4]
MNGQQINSDLIRGLIDPILLSVLLDGDHYGYGLIKEIYTRSGDVFELKEPTLYSSLRRLEGSKLVEAYWGEETNGGRRKYYRITEAGREACRASFEEWAAVRELIDRLLNRAKGENAV